MTRARQLSRFVNASAFTIDSDYDVGINSTTPAGQLDVTGGVNITDGRLKIERRDASTSGDAHIDLRTGGNSTSRMEIYASDYTDDNSDWVFKTNANEEISFKIASNDIIHLKADGKVGLGTTNPQNKLHLVNAASNPVIRFDRLDNVRNNYIGISEADCLELAADESNLGTNSSIKFRVDGAERMNLGGNGELGIGTDNANNSSRLHLADYGADCRLRIESSGNEKRSGIEFYRETSSGVGKGGAAIWVEGTTDATAGKLRFGTSNNASLPTTTCRMLLTTAGLVGLNSESPDKTIDIVSSNTSAPWPGMNFRNTSNAQSIIDFHAKRGGVDNAIANIRGWWTKSTDAKGENVASIAFKTGSDTTNRDDGEITFHTMEGGSMGRRMTIRQSGVTSCKALVIDGTNLVDSGDNRHSQFNCAGSNIYFNTDTADRNIIGFAHSCTDPNSNSTGLTHLLVTMKAAGYTRLSRGGNGNNGHYATLWIEGKTVTSADHGNRIQVWSGDSNQLAVSNTAGGDYVLTNDQQNNSCGFYDGTGGVRMYYNNDTSEALGTSEGYGFGSIVYANTTGSSANVHVSSTNYLRRSTSSRRYKNNIRDYVGLGVTMIKQLKPRTWEDFTDGFTTSGFIAEELHESGLTAGVNYDPYVGGSEIGIGDTFGRMYGNGSTPVTKTGEALADEVEVVESINERVITSELVIAIQQLASRVEALESA